MLTTAEVRALVTTSMADADLEEVIAREEAWLARRVGPLEGERVETFAITFGDEVLNLTRPAEDLHVEDDSGDVAAGWLLRGWADIVPDTEDNPHSWVGEVRVTYTPSDGLEVKRSLVTLVRLAIHESAYQSQMAGGYSATVSLQDQRTMRFTAWRTLLRPRQPTTTRLRSTVPLGGRTVGAVGVESLGS